MREKWLIANWKMNLLFDEAVDLVMQLNEQLIDVKTTYDHCALCPPFPYLGLFTEMIHHDIQLGAQCVSRYEKGAYTGDVSAAQLHSLGLHLALVGHSERRSIFNEDANSILAQLKQCLSVGVKPVLCVGEPLSAREQGKPFSYVLAQLEETYFTLSPAEMSACILAYEPIWAIGTGKTASPEQANEMHKHIRSEVAKRAGEVIANDLSILYGGSVKPANAQALFAQEHIDGGLIGGASLKAETFVPLAGMFPV